MPKLPSNWLQSHRGELTDFIYTSFQHRYYSGTVDSDDTPICGEPSFEWQKHNWRYQDWFWGGEPFAGTIVISWRESAARDWIECWVMSVNGSLEPDLADWQITCVYDCLDQALKNAPKDHPYRGPITHIADYQKDNPLHYFNTYDDTYTVDHLSGTESISSQSGIMFKCHYRAGVINTLY